jgi:hypothetical protein
VHPRIGLIDPIACKCTRISDSGLYSDKVGVCVAHVLYSNAPKSQYEIVGLLTLADLDNSILEKLLVAIVRFVKVIRPLFGSISIDTLIRLVGHHGYIFGIGSIGAFYTVVIDRMATLSHHLAELVDFLGKGTGYIF